MPTQVKMRNFNAVVFDLDGTLVHSAPDIHAAMESTLKRLGRAPLDLPTVLSFVGHGVENLVARCLIATGGGDDALLKDALSEFLRVYEANGTRLTKPYPGVIACLDKLAALDIPLGICTNKVQVAALQICDELDMAKYFQVIQGSVSDVAKKPDPAMLFGVIEALGVAHERALYVGDSEIDQATALNADVAFAFFTGGYLNADLVSPPPQISFDSWLGLDI